MTSVDYNLLAILPDFLIALAVGLQFLSERNLEKDVDDEDIRERIRGNFQFTFSLETVALATVNGIIYGELSGSFSSGTGFLIFGVFLGISSTSLLRNDHGDLAEYSMATLGLLFLYEFIYFLSAGTTFNMLGWRMAGWQIALVWFLGIIGASVAALFIYAFLAGREDTD